MPRSVDDGDAEALIDALTDQTRFGICGSHQAAQLLRRPVSWEEGPPWYLVIQRTTFAPDRPEVGGQSIEMVSVQCNICTAMLVQGEAQQIAHPHGDSIEVIAIAAFFDLTSESPDAPQTPEEDS